MKMSLTIVCLRSVDSSEQKYTSQTYPTMPGPPESTPESTLRTTELQRRRASSEATMRVKTESRPSHGAVAKLPGSALLMRGLPGRKDKAAACTHAAP